MCRERVLGVDVGGVIIDVPTRLGPHEWPDVKRRILSIPPVVPFAAMRRVFDSFEHIYLVSAAGDEEVARTTVEWLRHWNFWEQTGTFEQNLFFCPVRYGAKLEILRRLPHSIDIFVDDRPENLEELREVVDILFFFDRGEGENPPSCATTIRSWDELAGKLHSST